MSKFIAPIGYQRNVYMELMESARDYFHGSWSLLPINVRIAPLIVGSTGTGKTFLVRRLAAELKLPLFVQSAGDWILSGCQNRGAPPTLPRLYEFIDRHERGVIFVDEVEKLGDADGATDWRRFLQLEIFSVLDRQISSGVLEVDELPKFKLDAENLAERFKRGFLIVAAGAWQSLWTRNGESIGFSQDSPVTFLPDHKRLAATLRLEILNRFSSRTLLMPPLTAEDYREAFLEIIERVPVDVREVLPMPSEAAIREAVASQKGFRFFEEQMAEAIRSMRIAKETASPPVGRDGVPSLNPQPV